ncbi:MAG: hypothetical protein SFU86_15330 [Pirellulaceae bacterium]|nr:hypothetical protein [Pirellulaceae bacterium]
MAFADVGDPQIKTDHAWYPGELACTTFERLQATQAQVYERVTGRKVRTDEDKALASWLWRNTHYAHGEEGAENLWGKGFTAGGDLRTREYWTGLFAHGFGLCGTTHSQWVAEMDAILGFNRGRGVGVNGHNAFEVLLIGGKYGNGKWCLLDHDLSTVIFNADGSALLSLAEVQKDWKRLTDRQHDPARQQGWLVCGLHPGDGGSYASYKVAEYLAGYSGPPPTVHLRHGETLRRYFRPGLQSGKTFVFWGRNYNTAGIPGPERSHTWVNQPDAMHRSTTGAGYKPGQARFGNAVYVYRPDFQTGGFREGVAAATETSLTFDFYTPYIIAATPPDHSPWGIYKPGCKNGLMLTTSQPTTCDVAISVDQGATWTSDVPLTSGLDFTDVVKGHRQYLLRLKSANNLLNLLQDAGLTITTVCQLNPAILPRLKDDGTNIEFAQSNRAVISAGPNLPQAKAHLVAGDFGTPSVTLELRHPDWLPTSRDTGFARSVEVFAAAHVQSGNPPRTDVRYFIECSPDGGKTWADLLTNWHIVRRGDEPGDFWSQSLCWGRKPIRASHQPILVRYRNSGGRNYLRAEAHLGYVLPAQDRTRVTFAWTDDTGPHQADHEFSAEDRNPLWHLPTGRNVSTDWVEFQPIPAR